MERIEPELIRVFCPAFADVFVGCEPSKGSQLIDEVSGVIAFIGDLLPDVPPFISRVHSGYGPIPNVPSPETRVFQLHCDGGLLA